MVGETLKSALDMIYGEKVNNKKGKIVKCSLHLSISLQWILSQMAPCVSMAPRVVLLAALSFARCPEPIICPKDLAALASAFQFQLLPCISLLPLTLAALRISCSNIRGRNARRSSELLFRSKCCSQGTSTLCLWS